MKKRIAFFAAILTVVLGPCGRAGPAEINRERGSSGDERQLYILGGFKEGNFYSEVYSVSVSDLASGASVVWNKLSALPKALQGHTAVAVDNRIYVIGGLEGFARDGRAIHSQDVCSAEIRRAHLGERGSYVPTRYSHWL